MGIDTQCKKFNIVMNVPKDYEGSFEVKLISSCKSLFVEYSFILHDKDTTESGIVKTIHYHVVGVTESRLRIITLINKLATLMNIDTRLISCKKCVNYIGALQYLIHKNDKDKYQYDINAISSSLNFDDLKAFIDSDTDNITIDRLIFVVKTSRTLTEVIKQIGLSHYLGYRNVIKDLWNERYLLNE